MKGVILEMEKSMADGRFDPMTLVESSEYPPREGLPPVPVRERGFVPTEFILLFRLAGLSVLNTKRGSEMDAKKYFIVGGSSGIGLEIVNELSNRGG
jgi:hypothetical protein